MSNASPAPQGDGLAGSIIAAASEIHRDKGPSLIESIYEWSCIKLLQVPIDLPINFNASELTKVSRLIPPEANR